MVVIELYTLRIQTKKLDDLNVMNLFKKAILALKFICFLVFTQNNEFKKQYFWGEQQTVVILTVGF
jgi:hypothetical protein